MVSPSTDRKNRSRAREKIGLGCPESVVIDWFAWTQYLIDRKLLRENQIEDRKAVGEALSALLADIAARGFPGS